MEEITRNKISPLSNRTTVAENLTSLGPNYMFGARDLLWLAIFLGQFPPSSTKAQINKNQGFLGDDNDSPGSR